MTASTKFSSVLTGADLAEAALASIAPTQPQAVRRDIAEAAAEGLFMNIYSATETFVREYFFELVNGTQLASVFPSPLAALDPALNQTLIYLSSTKLDWMPATRVEERASAIFTLGHPFLRLRWRPTFSSRLSSAAIVRDRIAHSGEKAEERYWADVAAKQQAHTRPGAWLIAPSSEFSNPTSNLRVFLMTVMSMHEALTEASPDLDRLLGGKSAVPQITKAMPGLFHCTMCNTPVACTVGESIGSCTNSSCSSYRAKSNYYFSAL